MTMSSVRTVATMDAFSIFSATVSKNCAILEQMEILSNKSASCIVIVIKFIFGMKKAMNKTDRIMHANEYQKMTTKRGVFTHFPINIKARAVAQDPPKAAI